VYKRQQHSAASAEEFSVTASELTKQADALKLAIGKFQVEDIE
jgi:methyl-accepting chemotaxis protein